VEEHAIAQFLPGFSIWALGYWYGVGANEVNKDFFEGQNWLFFQYAPEFLTAQVRLGYDVIYTTHKFYVKPSVYGHFFDRKLKVGVSFQYTQDYGTKTNEGSPYLNMSIEPLVQFNMTSNSYIAFAYNWERKYLSDDKGQYAAAGLEPLQHTQWINFRVGMTF